MHKHIFAIALGGDHIGARELINPDNQAAVEQHAAEMAEDHASRGESRQVIQVINCLRAIIPPEA